jgi:hypothetical protein
MCAAYKFNFCKDYSDLEYPQLTFRRERIVVRDSNGRDVLTAPHFATRDFGSVAGPEYANSYTMLTHGIVSSNSKNDIIKNFINLHASHSILVSPSHMIIHKGPIESQIDYVFRETLTVDGGIMLRREALAFLLKVHLDKPMTEKESSFNPYVLLKESDKAWVDEVFYQAKIMIVSAEASGFNPDEETQEEMKVAIMVLFMASLNKRHIADEIFTKDKDLLKKLFKELDNLIL